TARLALEQDREVFAVPGSPLDPRAEGANSLIQQGARLVTGAADIIEALAGADPSRGRLFEPDWEPEPGPDADEEPADDARGKLLSALSLTPTPVDVLVTQTQLSAAVVQTLLLELDIAGRLE